MSKKERRYYWLQLNEGFFNQKEIKRLRKIAGGDTYTVIYLKMLLKSLQTNGFLYFDGIENNFISELALDIDEDEDNVEITVNYLKGKGLLVEKSEDEFFLTACPEMTGSETASARRMRKMRNNNDTNALQSDGSPSQCYAQTSQIYTDVTKCYTEIEVDKEIEKDKELELERELEKEGDKDKKLDTVAKIVELYNTICTSYPPVTPSSLSEQTINRIKKSGTVFSYYDMQEAFKKVEVSPFLKGDNKEKWVAKFGWIVKEENLRKILNGEYD